MCNNSSKECSQSSSAATVDLYADTFVAHPPKQKLSYAPELGNYESIRHVENLYSYDRRLMTGASYSFFVQERFRLETVD